MLIPILYITEFCGENTQIRVIFSVESWGTVSCANILHCIIYYSYKLGKLLEEHAGNKLSICYAKLIIF